MVIFFLFSCSKKDEEEYYNADKSLITQQQAIALVQDIIDQYEVAAFTINIVTAKTLLVKKPQYGRKSLYSPNFDAWLCIINTNPRANSGDVILYIFINAKSGELTKFLYSDFPDEGAAPPISIKRPASFPEPRIEHSAQTPVLDKRNSLVNLSNTIQKWAVIINGGICKENNWKRYWNDCSEIYKTLRNTYNFTKSNIFVLMSDGTSSGLDRNLGTDYTGPYDSSPTDLDGDGLVDVTHSATSNNINTVFNYLGQHVNMGDIVFIYVIDHGTRQNNQSYICLWNNQSISSSSFATQVNKITSASYKHIVLGQCYSGGFISDLSGATRTVVTACAANESSYAMSNGIYDEFVYHWTNAMRGATPSGMTINADLDGYTGISAYEAFYFAQYNDSQDETPQYYSSTDAFGKQYGFGGPYFSSPTISGTIEAKNNDYVSVTTSNLLAGSSTQWSYDNCFNSPSTGNNSITLHTNISEPFSYGTVYATVSNSYVTFSSLSHNITIWNTGYFQDNGYINGNDTSFSISCPEGAYDFQWGCNSSDWDVQAQGQSFVEFYNISGNPSAIINSVWVAFRNPFGNQIIIEKQIQ